MNNYDVLNRSRKDLVEAIIELMKREGLDWTKGWASNSRPYNPVSDIKYRGGNVLRLAVAAYNNGYKDPRWLTYTQAQEKGWQVKKGSHGVRLEKWVYDKEETVKDPVTGEEKKQKVRLEKPIPYYFTVFNAEQIAGIPSLAHKKKLPRNEMFKLASNIVNSSECMTKETSTGRCFYVPSKDTIYLPPPDDFYTNEGYLATALHEMAHSTGHASRLNRPLINGFGSPDYAKEELVAELASAFTQQILGINLEANLENHAAYLQSWIKLLENDPNELFRAAGAADKASDRIVNNYEKYIERENDLENYIKEANKKVENQNFGFESEYMSGDEIPKRLSKKEAKTALHLGIKVESLSDWPVYSGNHKDDYYREIVEWENIDNFEQYCISPDYKNAYVDVNKLYGIIKEYAAKEQENFVQELKMFLEKCTDYNFANLSIDTLKTDIANGDVNKYLFALNEYRQKSKGNLLIDELMQVCKLGQGLESISPDPDSQAFRIYAAVESVDKFSNYSFSTNYHAVFINDYGDIQPLTSDQFITHASASVFLKKIEIVTEIPYDKLADIASNMRKLSQPYYDKQFGK